ncbi:DUF4350 domain-containing protein [Brevundimonas sp.]|jgi:hypothetical protein|uniref:DUF4350 domain-containing protein n=1 Tax=Brevundimonas sp. TaxID=1871086 RepID=UPI0025C31096|nr:DUF4350 domain-containing protein [Brevundimonas sp.]
MSLRGRFTDGGFSPVAMLGAVLVGVVALAGIGLLSAYGPELRSGDDGGGHALSRASIGYGALPALLRGVGKPVVMNRGALTEAAYDSLLVLTPTPASRPDTVEDLLHDGPTLIVLPKWASAPDADHPGWVRTLGVLAPEAALAPLPEALREDLSLATRAEAAGVALRRPDGTAFGAPVRIDNLRTLTGPGWIPVLVDERGQPVLLRHGRMSVYVLAEPDLINTQGLRTLNGARTAVSLLELIGPGSPVMFDLTLHGLQRTRNLLRLLVEPPLLGLTLALLGLAALAGLQAAVRFGPARTTGRVIALGKRGLADNTAGLVRLARREHHMAAPYALLMRAAVARAIGAPRNLDDAGLNAFLDRVGRTAGATDAYSALAVRASAARNRDDLMRIAADLHRWKQELTRARQ